MSLCYDREVLKAYGTHFALKSKRETKFVFDFWFVLVVRNYKLRIKILNYSPSYYFSYLKPSQFSIFINFFLFTTI